MTVNISTQKHNTHLRTDDASFKRGNGNWPDDIVRGGKNLHSCCHDSGQSNTITTHMGHLWLPLLVLVTSSQRFRIFGSQKEGVSYL